MKSVILWLSLFHVQAALIAQMVEHWHSMQKIASSNPGAAISK